MRREHPNLAKIELIADALEPLRDQLVFVGGCLGCAPQPSKAL